MIDFVVEKVCKRLQVQTFRNGYVAKSQITNNEIHNKTKGARTHTLYAMLTHKGNYL